MKNLLKKYFIFYIFYLGIMFLVSDEEHYLQNSIPPPLTFMACDSVYCVCNKGSAEDCPNIIETNTQSEKPYLTIDAVTPNTYYGIGQVSITIKAGGWTSAGCENVDVKIYMLNGNDSCYTGYSSSQCLYKDLPQDFIADPHTFNSPCNLTQHTYRISAFLESENLYTTSTFSW